MESMISYYRQLLTGITDPFTETCVLLLIEDLIAERDALHHA